MDVDIQMIPSSNGSPTQFSWFKFPQKVRQQIAEMFDEDSKLLFALCSDGCSLDIPENFIKKVTFNAEHSMLWVQHSDHLYYAMYFQMVDGICQVTFDRSKLEEGEIIWKRSIWNIEEDGNIFEVIAKYFQRIIIKSTHLDSLIIDSRFPEEASTSSQVMFPFQIVGIRHVTSLKRLEIHTGSWVDLFRCGFMAFEQLRHIEGIIEMEGVPVDLHQLQNINATDILIHSLRMSSNCFNQYLHLFANSHLDGSIRKVGLEMARGYRINMKKVVDGLKVIKGWDDKREEWKIKGRKIDRTSFALLCNSKKNGRIAIINLNKKQITMEILPLNEFFQRSYLYAKFGRAVKKYSLNN